MMAVLGEIDGRCGLGTLVTLKVRLGLIKPEPPGDDRGWEPPALRIKSLCDLVVSLSFDRDPILCALELGLQVSEVLGRLDVGILLDHNQKSGLARNQPGRKGGGRMKAEG